MLPTPFNSLDEQELSVSHLSKGDYVFRQGDPTKGLFFVISGEVCLMRVTEAGNHVTIYNARANDTFAEASIYSEAYHCDAVCPSPSEIVQISKKAVRIRQRKDAAFSEALTKRMALQVQSYRQLLTFNAVKSASDRVYLAVTSGMLSGPVTQFASQIGLTKEACYRALRDLTTQGMLIKTGRGRYIPSRRNDDRKN